MKKIIKALFVLLLIVALLGGFDLATQGHTTAASGVKALQQPAIGIVQPVSAQLCPDGHSGC